MRRSSHDGYPGMRAGAATVTVLGLLAAVGCGANSGSAERSPAPTSTATAPAPSSGSYESSSPGFGDTTTRGPEPSPTVSNSTGPVEISTGNNAGNLRYLNPNGSGSTLRVVQFTCVESSTGVGYETHESIDDLQLGSETNGVASGAGVDELCADGTVNGLDYSTLKQLVPDY
jgi:hypothetical protein